MGKRSIWARVCLLVCRIPPEANRQRGQGNRGMGRPCRWFRYINLRRWWVGVVAGRRR